MECIFESKVRAFRVLIILGTSRSFSSRFPTRALPWTHRGHHSHPQTPLLKLVTQKKLDTLLHYAHYYQESQFSGTKGEFKLPLHARDLQVRPYYGHWNLCSLVFSSNASSKLKTHLDFTYFVFTG